MVDICKCKGNENHPQCSTCFRKLATASEYQSFGDFYKPDTFDCEYYWHVSDDNELKELNRLWRD